MTMGRETREQLTNISNQLEGAVLKLISAVRDAAESPTDRAFELQDADLRAAREKLAHRDAVITELAEWASAEDCLAIADKPEKVVAQLMQAMVSNRDLRIKQLQDENAELKLRPRPETAEKNANDANAALARVRGLEDHLRTLNAANANLLRDRGGALDLLERHTTAWPSVDASLDAETRGFLFSCGRRMPKRDDHVRAGPPSPCPPMGGPSLLDDYERCARLPLQPVGPGLAPLQPINNRVGPGFGKPLDPVGLRVATPVCKRCNDTHLVFDSHSERMEMCTFCPVPCDKCRKDGNGPYCATTPCTCDCHKPKDPQ